MVAAATVLLHPRVYGFRMARILLLDDDDVVRLVTAELLAELGHIITPAATCEVALDVLSAVHIDLLVTDIRMPGEMNGWDMAEAARLIREELPIVYMSGFSPYPIRTVAGAAYLHKPFTLSELREAVEVAINGIGMARGTA